MPQTAKSHERLVVVVPPTQKAAIAALADSENLSVGAVVRRALSRELRLEQGRSSAEAARA